MSHRKHKHEYDNLSREELIDMVEQLSDENDELNKLTKDQYDEIKALTGITGEDDDEGDTDWMERTFEHPGEFRAELDLKSGEFRTSRPKIGKPTKVRLDVTPGKGFHIGIHTDE